MSRAARVWIVGLGLVLAFAVASPTSASQDGEPKAEKGSDDTSAGPPKAQPKRSPWVQATGGKRTGGTTKVYSNEDLERLSGLGPASAQSPPADTTPTTPTDPGAETTAPPADATQEKSALDLLFEQEAARRERAEAIRAAEQRVEAARQRIVDSEKRLLATRNPFLARPKAPEEGWEPGDGEQRVKQSQDVLQAARDELAKAEQDLDKLRRSAP